MGRHGKKGVATGHAEGCQGEVPLREFGEGGDAEWDMSDKGGQRSTLDEAKVRILSHFRPSLCPCLTLLVTWQNQGEYGQHWVMHLYSLKPWHGCKHLGQCRTCPCQEHHWHRTHWHS